LEPIDRNESSDHRDHLEPLEDTLTS
jgi:hypothetical protein